MSARRRDRNGQWTDRKVQSGRYYCRQIHEESISPDCPRNIGSKKADKEVWEKVCRVVNKPKILLVQARKMVDELRANANILEAEQERIQRELCTLMQERQWTITQARKGSITDEDMEYQLGAIELQEHYLKQELASIGQAVNIHLLDNWEDKIKEYLVNLQVGLESLNAIPKNAQDQQEIFDLKKEIVNTLVRRVTINRNRELDVEIRIDLLKLLTDDTIKRFEGKNQDQIKTAGIHLGWRDAS